jgi:putative hemolysin
VYDRLMTVWITFAVFVVLFALSGLFSGSEIALFSLSRAAVNKMQRQKRVGAEAISKLRKNPHKLLVTILIGNNIVNIYAAALATAITIELFGSRGVGVATGVVTFMILLFGEIFPKALAQAYAQTIALNVARPLLLLSYILWPLVLVLEWLSRMLIKIMPGKVESTMKIEDEIKSLLMIGLEEGSTELYERDFIERLFKFDDTPVSDVMVAYEKTVLVDGSVPIDQISHFLAKSGYSRFPVYQGSRNNVVGMVHVKDVFRANNSDDRKNSLVTLAQQAVNVRVDEKLDDAFNVLRQKKIHSALVQDKNSTVVGFVTLEDILERLVGDIQDESDRIKEA